MPVVLVEKQSPHVSLVTLNRPERRNALTVELMKELISAVESLSADAKQRVLILRGAGKCFCAGLDLQETALTQDAHAAAEIVAKTLITLEPDAIDHNRSRARRGRRRWRRRHVGM